MDACRDSFLFVNKSTTSRTLSRSKAKERAEIFRHVQRVRQMHDEQRPRLAAKAQTQIRTYSTCSESQDAKLEETLYKHGQSRGPRSPKIEVTRPDPGPGEQHYMTHCSFYSDEEDDADGIPDLSVSKYQDSAIQWLTGDAFDAFESFPNIAHHFPSATRNCPYPVGKAQSHLFAYIQTLDLTKFARKARLFSALSRPTVMFSHLMMVVMEEEEVNENLGRNLDRVFGTGALRHVRHEVQNIRDKCPWDLIFLVNILMFRAQAMNHGEIAKAHRGGLIAMIQRNGGLAALAASNTTAQAGTNGLILSEMLESAITGQPLHPILGDVAAGGNFPSDNKDKVPISPFYSVDGDFSELKSSPLSRPETIQLLESMWLLVQSVTQPSRHPEIDGNWAREYHQAQKAILRSREIAPREEARDCIYECCRLTAILLLKATENHLPLSSCVGSYPIVHQLEHHMKFRDSPASWGSFKGVYLNVIIVAFVAGLGTSARQYFHRLLGHALGYYACGVWEGGYGPLITLMKFQDFCRSESALIIPQSR